MSQTDILTSAAAATTYAKVGPAKFAPGLRWVFLGDSHTFGTGASNASYSFARQACITAGALTARRDSWNAGVASDTTALLLARTDTALASAGVQAAVILIGTNDAGNGTALSTSIANITAIINKCKAKGIPVVLCTIPPRGASMTTAQKKATATLNTWIRFAGPALGCEIADVYTAICDPTTGGFGTLNSVSYTSGDDVHMSDLGHQVAGAEIAKAMRRVGARTTPYGLITALSADVISLDPLGARATATGASGWYEWAGGTGTAPTYSMVNDASGRLAAGRWAQMDFDAVSGGTRRLTFDQSTGYTAGTDKVLYVFKTQVEDVSGTWRTDVAAGTAAFDLSMVNQAASSILASTMPRIGGIALGGGVYDLGEQAVILTVPSGTTKITPWHSHTEPTGRRVKARVGEVGLWNLTAQGLDTYIDWGNSMVSV